MFRRAIGAGLTQGGGYLVLTTLWDWIRHDRPVHGQVIVCPLLLGFAAIGAGIALFIEFERTHRWMSNQISGIAAVAMILTSPWTVLEPLSQSFTTRSLALTGLGLWCALVGAIVVTSVRRSRSTAPADQP